MPKTNTRFWRSKFNSNKTRDDRAMRELRELDWHPIVVWECRVEDKPESVLQAIRRVLAKRRVALGRRGVRGA